MATDIYNKPPYTTSRPITADMLSILWSDSGGTGQAVLQANNFQFTYQRQVTKRYTLNSPQNYATIYPGRAQGSITIGRLMCDKEQNLFLLGGWDDCQNPAVISWSNTSSARAGGNCNTELGTYTARGCWVASYGGQADADSLVVLDNVNIDFLQLEFDPA